MYSDRILIPNKKLRIIAAILIMIGLYLSSLYHYLLFHSLAEIFSIVIALGIFMITWNARQYISNGYLLFIGTAYLFVGLLDLIHTLAFKGMPIFSEYGTNLPTQLWIAARYMESLTLLVSLYFIKKNVRVEIIFVGYTFATILIILSIFQWKLFPICFIEGVGITMFKRISEYFISLILLASLFFLFRNKTEFDESVLRWISISIVMTIASELTFTCYMNAYDFSNLIGHYLKILSFYCMYKAIIEISILKPYNLMFRELKQSEKKYRALFKNMMDGIARYKIVLDDHGNPVDFIFLEVNDAFEKLTGFKREEIVGKRVTEAATCLQVDADEWIQKFGDVAMTGKSVRFEGYLNSLNRYYSVMVYSHEKGYFVTIFEDITDRKIDERNLQNSHDDLEQVVKERTAELKDYAEQLVQKNKELEEFTYAASHDLQEPLRKIQMFGSKLEKLDKDKLSDKSIDYIHRMIKASNRMRQLVQDLLLYSRISLKPRSNEQIHLRKALDRALENLEARIKQTSASIVIGDLPIIEADVNQMTQLFQNLVGNALKFSKNDTNSAIEIYAKVSDKSPEDGHPFFEIYIKDNGVGFDQKFVEKIFQPFERLDHQRKDEEGTGIGLAICRRIVERHDGGINAKSKPGEGSTFIVTLPLSQIPSQEYVQQYNENEHL